MHAHVPPAKRGTLDALRDGRCDPLLLEHHRRPGDARANQVDRHLDAIGDLDEGDAAVHAVVPAIECHRPLGCALAGALAGDRQRKMLRLGHSADGEVTVQFESVRAGLYDLGRFECDVRIVLGVEEILFSLLFLILVPVSTLSA
jgi:hypothetical protein